jgi:hypothetical protein
LRTVYKRAFVIALCAVYAAYLLLTRPPGPVTTPDSRGLLAMAPIHWLGYPVFLRLAGANGAMILQPLVFAASLAAIGLETLGLTSSVLLSSLVVLAAMLVPEARTYHYSVLSESLFMSGTLGFLASVIAFLRRPSLSTVVVAVAIASLTSTVRNAAIVYIPIAMVMVLGARQMFRQWRAGLVAAILPAIVIVGGERAAARVVHGDEVTSLIGRHSFAKAALIDAPMPDAYAPVRRVLAAAPTPVRDVLTVFYESCLQGPCVEGLGTSDASFTPKATNAALERAGLARLSEAPWGYVTLTAAEYRSMWKPFRLREPSTVAALNAFVASHRPMPFETEVFKVGPRDPLVFEASPAAGVIQPVVIALGIFTALLAVFVVVAAMTGRPLAPAMMASGCAALAAHGALHVAH